MPAPTEVALLALAGAAGLADLRSGRIGNTITYGGVACGVLLGGVESGLPGLGLAVLGTLLALAVGVPLFLLGGMGGGDVKLYAAVGALVGPGGLLEVAAISLGIGACAAVVLLAWRGELGRTIASVALFFATALLPRVAVVAPRLEPRLRFGVCIALGAAAWAWARRAGWS